MKLFKRNKYRILLNFLKYSFVGVFAFALIMSTIVLNSSTKVADAITSPTLSVISTTSNSVTLIATGLTVGSTYRINLINSANVIGNNHWDLNSVTTTSVTTTSPSTSPLVPDTYIAKLSDGSSYIAASGSFIIAPVNNTPKIISFSPISGKGGDTITITGQNFAGTSKVRFGEIANAIPSTINNNTITVVVPNVAVTGKIYLFTNHGNTESATDFIVTAGGNGSSTITVSNIKQTAVDLTATGLIDPEYSFYAYDVIKKSDNSVIRGVIDESIIVNGRATSTITGLTSNSQYNVNLSNSQGNVIMATTSFTTLGGTGGSATTNTITNNGDVQFKGLVPICNTIVDTVKGGFSNPCDFDMILAGVNRIINFLLITLATPLFALILIYVGWLYLSDMGSAENVGKAKKIFKNVIIGYIIALAAWLIVKTILSTLGFDPKDAFLVL